MNCIPPLGCPTFKIILILFTLIWTTHTCSQDGWELKNSQTSEHIFAVDFVDSAHGWFVGAKGIVFHSQDGGETWTPQNSFITSNLNAVSFVNDSLGWAAGDSGVVLKTSDGGNNWIPLPINTESDLSDVAFFDEQFGLTIALSSPVEIFRTNDGGASWQPSPLTLSFPALSLFIVNRSWAAACGGFFDFSGYTTTTRDGGVNWSPALVISSEPIFDLHFFDELNGFAVGGDIDYGATAWMTTDGAESWIPVEAPLVLQPLFKICFVDETIAWSCGAAGRLFKYNRQSREWIEYPSGTAFNLYDIDFVDPANGWMCGENGYLAKYQPLISSISAEKKPALPSIKLEANYPNPFNSRTRFPITLQKSSRIRLTIYDILGQEIKTLLDSFLPAGRHEISWDGTDRLNRPLNSGIYFLRVKSAGLSGHKCEECLKLLLLR
ncbi:MAG: hypothetical protein Kow0042_10720 [Calditrichia bacterium]